MTLFTTLLLGHLLGDFLLQTNWVFNFKSRSWVGIVIHTLIHLAATALLLRNWLQLWDLLALLGILHFFTDWIKVRYPSRSLTLDFVLDQFAHLVVITLLAFYWGLVALPILPAEIMVVSIYYATVPALCVFVWVIALEFVLKGYENLHPLVWIQKHLLRFSQYAGIPLLVLLMALIIRGNTYGLYATAHVEDRAETVMQPSRQHLGHWQSRDLSNNLPYIAE